LRAPYSIAGKSIPDAGTAKVFALVRRVDRKPKRRLRNVLESQGILPRQQITFLSDGGDTRHVRYVKVLKF
jgi:hypothetical protein